MIKLLATSFTNTYFEQKDIYLFFGIRLALLRGLPLSLDILLGSFSKYSIWVLG